MAVEYETTPSTPGNSTATSIFPIAGTVVKKRVLKHTCQENFRANLFFCGKRKRSHRDRYFEQHSSSVPRQRDLFGPKNSYSEYRSRNRSFSKPCERILPLNKSIVSKIEKISQDSKNSKICGFQFLCLQDRNVNSKPDGLKQMPVMFSSKVQTNQNQLPATQQSHQPQANTSSMSAAATSSTSSSHYHHHHHHYNHHPILTYRSESFGSVGYSPFSTTHNFGEKQTKDNVPAAAATIVASSSTSSRKHRHKRLQMQLQFEDNNIMDCGNLNEFLSSSSMSSSDSEAAETNESDREGDDELTDWPGNEAMVNFTSKNDFKRANKPRKQTLGPIKSDELGQDDDTLMSADEIVLPQMASNDSGIGIPLPTPSSSLQLASTATASHQLSVAAPQPPTSLNLPVRYSPAEVLPMTTMPIDITASSLRPIHSQIESEMSGETSNHFLSSPNTNEVREIRAGCRRVRNERPGFTILTSVNEDLAK